jgi:transcriptional regulator with XRE-family HTH domain
MDHVDKYRAFVEKVEKSVEYHVDCTALQLTEELTRAMTDQGVSRAELARRLGTSPAYVSKVLRGDANLTLATITKLAMALGRTVHIGLEPRHRRQVTTKSGPEEPRLGTGETS